MPLVLGYIAKYTKIPGFVAAVHGWRRFATRQLPPQAQAFCNNWLLERSEAMASIALFICLIVHTTSLLTDPMLTDLRTSVLIFRAAHLCTLLVCAVTIWRAKADRHFYGIGFYFAIAPSMAGFLGVLFFALHRGPTMDPYIMQAWTAYLCASLFHVSLIPSHRFWPPFICTAVFVAASMASWAGNPFIRQVAVPTVWGFVMIALYHFGQSIRAVHQALQEYEAQLVRSRTERAVVERELELARQIQDSLAAPRELRHSGLIASCFQRKHSQVCGDWVGMRVVGSDMFVLVADAAGKGIQAALVIHAVQALWAETLHDRAFDPLTWLTRVNRSLRYLGAAKVHMVTMGILRLSAAGGITYWSAGHLPAFVITDGRVQVLASRGSPLGINPEVRTSPASLATAHAPATVLLGSDGIFYRGALHRHREVLAIRDAVRHSGLAALDISPAIDDKTLVCIECH